MIKSYRDLQVWKKSMDYVVGIYQVLRSFPKEERYGLCDQLRRAAVSIPSNIAEGSGRDSAKDYAHFLNLAKGSLNETVTQLEISYRLGYLDSGTGLYEQSVEIGKMLNVMIKKLRAQSLPTSSNP